MPSFLPFPHANGNDRDVCPFGCVIRASQRISPVAGVAPANRRSDKSTDGRTDAEDRAKAALGAAPFLRPRCRCRRERSGKIASTSSSLFTTIECAIRVAPFIAAGPFFASELGQNNARAIGRIGDASEASSAARRQWNRFLPAILPLSVDRRCHYRLHTVNMSKVYARRQRCGRFRSLAFILQLDRCDDRDRSIEWTCGRKEGVRTSE